MKSFFSKNIIVTFIISIFLTSSISVDAADINKNSFSKEAIKEDVKFLFDKMERIHPHLYFASNKDEVKEKVENMLSNMDDSMSELEFYKSIAPIISMLNDGHTTISLPDVHIKNIQASKNIIPIGINIDEDKLYVDKIITKEYFDQYKGYEILSINSKTGKEIYEEIKNDVFGKQESFRNARIAKSFIPLYYLYNDFNDHYILELKDANKNIIKLDLKGISNYEYENNFKNEKNDTENKRYAYKVIDQNIALIELNSFADFKGFEVFLEDTFKDINKNNIKELIIDLRKNGGGDATLGDLLVEYIYDGKYKRCGKFGLKVTEEILDHYEKNNWMSKEEINKLRAYMGQNYEEDKIQAYRSYKEKAAFNGDVYVLIGKNTYSAATMFASMIKDYNIGYLIGEETGGLATSYTNSYYFKLPNTKLLAGVSFQYVARPNGLDTGRGVLPDYDEKDIEKDALDIAIEIIQSKRN